MSALSRDEERRARAIELAIKATLGDGRGRTWSVDNIPGGLLIAAAHIDRFIEKGKRT